MIVYEIDGNSNWIDPIKNRSEGEIFLPRHRSLIRMKLQVIVHKNQLLDNEISAAYKSEIQAMHLTYQFVPPNDHRRKIAEKEIQTWKDHFVGVLTGTASTLPMHIWCQ